MQRGLNVLLCVLALAVPATANADEFNLVCSGRSTRTGASTSQGSNFNISTGQTTSGSYTTYHRVTTDDDLVVEIRDEGSRIRVPRSLIPTLRSGGHDGWWDLTDIALTEDQISGRFSLNFVNKPRVRIDRHTGLIDIDALGASGFHGQCERYDPSPEARRF